MKLKFLQSILSPERELGAPDAPDNGTGYLKGDGSFATAHAAPGEVAML